MAQEIADSTLLDTWASSGLIVEPDISKIIEGWQLGEQPPHEYMNWLQNTFGSKLNHILKNGIAKWNNETEYLAGATIQHNGSVWRCKTTNTNSEPTELNNNWEKLPSLENLALTVDTINDFPTSATTGDTCIVKDLDRGGIFIYDSSKVAEHNGGTNFNGWIRQYSGVVNVKWFGARGDGVTDDTAFIQNALNTKSLIFFPSGTYKTSDTLIISDNSFTGSSIIGEDKKNTIITSTLTGTTPILSLKGGSGASTNITIKNITIFPDNNYTSTGIYIDGQCNANFERIEIKKCNYGIWLHNQSSGSFTEVNNFNDIVLDYCNNGVRLEKGGGNDSFHGNNFNNIYINIGENQIGFNHVSGYYYNGRFRLFMWAHDTTSVYVNAGANTEHCIGDITYESFKVGQITGIGRFWFSGFIRGIGGINDNTVQQANTEEVFSCSNYLKSKTQATTGHNISSLYENGQKHGGGDYGLYRAAKLNDESFLLNGYNYGSNGKLYLGRTEYQQELSNSAIGMHINLNGEEIKTYSSNGLTLKDSSGNWIANVGNDKFAALLRGSDSQVISSGGGSVTLGNTGYMDKYFAFFVYIFVTGSNYEYRYLYAVNHDGYGANAYSTLLHAFRTFNNTGGACSAPVITFNSNSDPVVSVASSDRNLTVIAKRTAVGAL